MKLYIVRHGETFANIKDILSGQSPAKLTKKGKKQARQIGERLSKMPIDVVYCSDLKRCKQTIKPFLKIRKVPIYYTKELRERSFGIMEGKSWDKVEEWKKKTNQPKFNFLSKFPKGESFEEAGERVFRFFKKIQKKHKEENVLFVTHGSVKRSFLSKLLNRKKAQNKLRSQNTALSIIQINENGKHKARLINSVEHLDTEIVVNFKNYKQGEKVIELAKNIEKYLPEAIVCVPATEIKETRKKTKLDVFAQNVSKNSEKETGFIIVKELAALKAKGSLLNHSENKIDIKKIEKIVWECRKAKLKTIVCASSVDEANKIKRFKPWAIAFEDKELIGTGKSITDYKSREIRRFVNALKDTRVLPLCGAGISSVADILKARDLGCRGVLIASAIAKSRNPEKLLKEISQIS